MPRARLRSSSSASVSPTAIPSSSAPNSPRSAGTRSRAARSCTASATSRCCAPSCRSRSNRRRAWSALATILARDWIRSLRASAPAIAVATSSLNSASRCSVSAARRIRRVPTMMPPHRRPSTRIGASTAERKPSCRRPSGTRSVVGPSSSQRAVCPAARSAVKRGSVLDPRSWLVRRHPSGRAQERDLTVRLVPHDPSGVGVEEQGDLLSHRGEQESRLGPSGDEQCQAPHRSLLVGDAAQLVPRFGARDARRDQVGEHRHALLGARQHRCSVARCDSEQSPEQTPDPDRGAQGRGLQATSWRRDRREGEALRRVRVDQRRPVRLEHEGGNGAALERCAGAGRAVVAGPAPGGDDRRHSLARTGRSLPTRRATARPPPRGPPGKERGQSATASATSRAMSPESPACLDPPSLRPHSRAGDRCEPRAWSRRAADS